MGNTKSFLRSGKVRRDVRDRIESSKVHWSQLTERELDLDDEQVAQENRQVFEELLSHPTWGSFFKTFGYDTKFCKRSGKLVVGKKFAEGAQAELFHAKVIWRHLEGNDENSEMGYKWVVKVFKRDTRLRELQAQCPIRYLRWWANKSDCEARGVPHQTRYRVDVYCGTLLQDGRFAFLLQKGHEDLRSWIDRAMTNIGNDSGPFSKDEVESIMFDVALGMDWLHNFNILHRDLKASNVLVRVKDDCEYPTFYVADFECSVGVIGTGFFRAPKVLQGIRAKGASNDLTAFTKATDMYSYGMTFYEVLTGKLPFEGHCSNDFDLVLHGERPRIPDNVDMWIKELLHRCWDVDCSKRPLFPEILELFTRNSIVARETQLFYKEYEEEVFRKYKEKVATRLGFPF